ncbi:MAG: WXG100 family type VII secretion target [Bacilli bacterium]|nr:WXG100 family type VII secretion target [Bacilli bacterium]
METTNLNLEINSAALDAVTNKIEATSNKIEELFNKINNSMKELHKSEIWSGDANESCYKRFQELSEYFPKINAGLDTYISFLRKTNENFVNAENSINRQVDTNEVELNVH